MKIVFVSNYLNCHHTVFCDSLKSKVDSFYFISGYGNNIKSYKNQETRDYVIYYKDNVDRAKAEILSADAVIYGDCPIHLICLRMKENKLSFIYSERLFKKNILQCLKLKNIKAIKRKYLNHKNNNLYVLAASAYLSYDLSLYGFPVEKMFKWGYFPEIKVSESFEKKKNSILYVGSFLDWKHAETVIEIANSLKKDKIDFNVSLVGNGPEEEKLKTLVQKYNLSDCVEFLGLKKHDEVLKIMSKHSIFMFTSSYQEGWGAVLNEAMASGCAVVASSAAGSTPYLVKHNFNGKVYKYGNQKNTYKAVKELMLNKEEMERLGNNASKTIKNEYNGEIAAERFVKAVKEFYSSGSITPREKGVMSQASILKNNWFKP